jgi:hypothetical protein
MISIFDEERQRNGDRKHRKLTESLCAEKELLISGFDVFKFAGGRDWSNCRSEENGEGDSEM